MRRRLLEALVWSALAYGIWLVSLSAVSAQEYVVGSLCALPCGAAAAGARWAVEGSWTLRPAWLLPLLALPVVIVSDAVQVLAAPWRRPQGRGRFETVPTAAAGGSVAGESRRAVATALVHAGQLRPRRGPGDGRHARPPPRLPRAAHRSPRDVVSGYTVCVLVLMLGGVLPALALASNGSASARLVGIEILSAVVTVAMLLVSQVTDESFDLIVPLVLVPVSVVGTLVFTRLVDAEADG